MITLKLWQLAELALPLMTLLGGQVVLMFLYAYFVIFTVMGRDYDAAVLSAGVCGFEWEQLRMPWQICRQSVRNMYLP